MCMYVYTYIRIMYVCMYGCTCIEWLIANHWDIFKCSLNWGWRLFRILFSGIFKQGTLGKVEFNLKTRTCHVTCIGRNINHKTSTPQPLGVPSMQLQDILSPFLSHLLWTPHWGSHSSTLAASSETCWCYWTVFFISFNTLYCVLCAVCSVRGVLKSKLEAQTV